MQDLDPYHVTLILTALITSVVSPVILYVTKHIITISKKSAKCEITRNLNIENLITMKLEKIRDYSGADRVWIAEFHNGGHTFSGRSMQKFSETYEVVRNGISQEGINTQNLPTSLFSSFFKIVSEDSIFSIKNKDAFTSMHSFFESRGIKSFLSLVIRNIENQTIGVICLDNVQREVTIDEHTIDIIRQDVNIISGYLESFLRK